MPRRLVFDSVTVPLDGVSVRLVGREEPFRALRKHEVPLCISPRYERLVEAVLGTRAIEGVEFVYPGEGDGGEGAKSSIALG